MQAYAVEMMYLLDSRDKQRDTVFDLKSRLVAARPEEAHRIFPEWFAGKIIDDDSEKVDGKVDENKIEWEMPDSVEEVDDIDAWVAEHNMMQVTGDDMMREWQ